MACWSEHILLSKGLSTAGCRKLVRVLSKKNGQLILCAWSSSEYSNNNAWNVNASNGGVNNNDKAWNNNYVRCVLAFGGKIIWRSASCFAGTRQIMVCQGVHVLFSKGLPTIKVRKLVLLLNQNRQLILCVWSSSEYDYRYAWIANANNGGVNWENSKNGKPYYVRCVLALGNKIKKYFCRNLPDYGLAG